MKNMSENKKTLILSIVSAVVMGLMIAFVYQFSIPNPNMILIVVLVFFASVGGWIPGGVSAILILLYSMFFFSTDHSFFQYTDQNMQKIITILVGDMACYAMVSVLKYNRDKSHRELAESNAHLAQMNKSLEEKARADARVAELAQSVTSLLTNMPALTFSKDISTGKYLACNQLFAEYAHKSSPEGVVGLTDHDIFDQVTADHFVEDDKMALSMDEPYVFFEDVADAAGFPRHFQTTKQKFVDEQGRLCTLGMCVDVTELIDMKRETQEIRQAFEESRYEGRIYSSIASSLSADYTFVYYVDLQTDEYVEYRAESVGAPLSVVVRGKDFFNEAFHDAQSLIYGADRESFLDRFNKRNIVAALENRELFTITYRLMIDGNPEYVILKASRIADDAQHVVIGVMNVDAQMRAQEAANRIKEERATYARMNALSQDYIALYTVDPETCDYREYSSSSLYDELGIVKEGKDFFATARKNARRVIHPDDWEKMDALFTRANVLNEIRANGIFTVKYRLVLDERMVHVRLKAALVEEKDGPMLIVGVINISEQVKQDEIYEYHLSVVRMLANRDELTGVKNKHAYAELEHELDQRIEGKEPVEFAVMVFDVNELKNVNDTKGHQAGDEYLKRACALICSTFAHSPVFRVGGDEFAVISQGADYENAGALVEQLESDMQTNQLKGDIAIACGMARYDGDRNVAAVFEKADKLMYENKRKMKTVSASVESRDYAQREQHV